MRRDCIPLRSCNMVTPSSQPSVMNEPGKLEMDQKTLVVDVFIVSNSALRKNELLTARLF